VYDYHVHTNYSDGAFLSRMVDAATDAGTRRVGITDHCNVSPDPAADGGSSGRSASISI